MVSLRMFDLAIYHRKQTKIIAIRQNSLSFTVRFQFPYHFFLISYRIIFQAILMVIPLWLPQSNHFSFTQMIIKITLEARLNKWLRSNWLLYRFKIPLKNKYGFTTWLTCFWKNALWWVRERGARRPVRFKLLEAIIILFHLRSYQRLIMVYSN